MNKSYLGSLSVQWLMKETDSKVTGAFFNKVYSSICVPCTEVSHEGDSTTIILQN